MCPLRLILIFLSATLAGFFVIKNLKSSPFSATTDTIEDDSTTTTTTTDSNRSSPHASDYSSSSWLSKVKSGGGNGVLDIGGYGKWEILVEAIGFFLKT